MGLLLDRAEVWGNNPKVVFFAELSCQSGGRVCITGNPCGFAWPRKPCSPNIPVVTSLDQRIHSSLQKSLTDRPRFRLSFRLGLSERNVFYSYGCVYWLACAVGQTSTPADSFCFLSTATVTTSTDVVAPQEARSAGPNIIHVSCTKVKVSCIPCSSQYVFAIWSGGVTALV
jgi:hypothetical protein